MECKGKKPMIIIRKSMICFPDLVINWKVFKRNREFIIKYSTAFPVMKFPVKYFPSYIISFKIKLEIINLEPN